MDLIDTDEEENEIIIQREGFTIGTLTQDQSILLVVIIAILAILLIALIIFLIQAINYNKRIRDQYESKLDLEAYSIGASPDLYFVKERRKYVVGYGKEEETKKPILGDVNEEKGYIV